MKKAILDYSLLKKFYILLWLLILLLSLSQCKKSDDNGGIPDTLDTSNAFTCNQCYAYGDIIEIQGNSMAISEENRVFLYERKNALWQLVQTIDYGRTSGVNKIIFQPSRLIVGYAEANGVGKVVIYTKQANGLWSQSQELSQNLHQDNFGNAIHVNGDRMIIGANAPWNDDVCCLKNDDIGRAYMYKLENNTWVYQSELVSPNSKKHDLFGLSVFLVDNFALVGSYNDTLVQVFENVNDNWRFNRYLPIKNGEAIAGYANEVLIRGYVDYDDIIKAYTVSNGIFMDKNVQKNTKIREFSSHGEVMDVYKGYALISSEEQDKCFLYRLNGNEWVIEQEFNNSNKVEAPFTGLAISDDFFVMGGRNFVKVYAR